jgi:glycosyltransferase involved in cell wall biosynthesis
MSGAQAFAVVIPTANRRHFVCQAIERALSQTLPPHEVIVVDDGSLDDTAEEVAKRFSNRVRLIQQAKQGVQAARNTGIQAANSEWIALLDDDDLWDCNYLETAFSFLSLAPDVGALFTSFRVCEADTIVLANKFRSAPDKFWDFLPIRRVGKYGIWAKFPVENSFYYQPFFPTTTIIRRDLLCTIGGHNPLLRGVKGEDYEFTFRILSNATCGFLMDAGATIRKHGSNDSANSKLLTIGELEVLDFIRKAHAPRIQPMVLALLDHAIQAKLHSALDAAFALAHPEMVIAFARRIENALSSRERLKLAISEFPPVVAPQLMKAFGAAGTLRYQIKRVI